MSLVCEKHGRFCDLSCKDPNVDNGMMTKVWGPAGWLFLHAITFGYPYAINPENPDHATKQEDYYKFFYYLGKVLPCKYCRESYQEFMNKLSPIDKLNTRKELTRWMYDLHNLVNDKLNVPMRERPSFEEVEKTYENYRARCAALHGKDSMEGFGTSESSEVMNAADAEVYKWGHVSGSAGMVNSIVKQGNQWANEKCGSPSTNGKGCTIPANGKPCRSVIKIVELPQATQPTDPNNFAKSNDYLLISKKTILAVIITLIIIILVALTMYLIKNKKIKL
jgi:hypothetical protein